MTAYRRVYDSRYLQADLPRTGISSGTLRSVFEYGLPFYAPTPLPRFVTQTVYILVVLTTDCCWRSWTSYSGALQISVD